MPGVGIFWVFNLPTPSESDERDKRHFAGLKTQFYASKVVILWI